MILLYLIYIYLIYFFINIILKNYTMNKSLLKNKLTNKIKKIKKKCNNLIYQPSIWNQNNNNIKQYNNCYAYAMRDLLYNRDKKPQPGDKCKNKVNLKIDNNYSCDNIISNIKCDYPYDILETDHNNNCPCDYYKVSLFLDNSKPNKDYHFYRKDNQYWSHKPGNSEATNLDASNKLINDPYTADRNYKNTKNKNNYTIPCKNFCKKKNINIYLDK